jgi:iron complex outermembrane receptor protein
MGASAVSDCGLDQRNLAATLNAIALSIAMVSICGGYSSAHAQEAPAASGLEEIVVTARRREESLQDTPVAISAFTGAALERQQIFSTQDLDRVTPNLQFAAYGPLTGNNSAAQIFIRGIGQTDASSGVDPGVGLYIDDVYMGRAVGGVMDFRDTANVQVLRGPQGTLFGRNTIGGAVLMATTPPGDKFAGTLRAGVGQDRLREVFGAATLPLIDGLAARVSVGARRRDGYVNRISDGLDLGDEDTYTLQSAARWNAISDFTVTLRGDYTKSNENGSPFVFAAINGRQAFPAATSVAAGCPGATFPPPNVPQNVVDPRCANDATWNLGSFANGGTAPARSTLENWGTSLSAQWKLSQLLTLKSITAYRGLTWTGARDADNTPMVILDTDYDTNGHQFSQELQALIDASRLKGVFGLFYFKEKYDDLLLVRYAAPPPAVAHGATPGSRDHQDANIDNDNYAAFTQWTYNLTDAVSFTTGARYTHETKGIQITAYAVNPYTNPDPATPPTVIGPGGLYVSAAPFERTFTAVTKSASAQYRWNPALMTYVSWSQGFKSGGFNQRFNQVPPGGVPIAFDPERAKTYEFGFKSEFGGSFRVNGAIFKTNYDNMQLIYRLGIVPLLFNAGKNSIKGGELEFTLAPGDLLIEGSVGYLDNLYDEIKAVPGTTATVGPGNTLPFTPKWQGNIGVGYAFHLAGGAFSLTPRVDLSYTAKQYFDAANSPEIAQLSNVTLLNTSLTFESPEKWRVTAGVDNATDKRYRVAGNSSFTTSAGYSEVVYARPRTWFVRASYDF